MVHTPDRRYIGDSYACAVVSLQHEWNDLSRQFELITPEI
jgi:hypothetical protein